jgi:hypothetical protein
VFERTSKGFKVHPQGWMLRTRLAGTTRLRLQNLHVKVYILPDVELWEKATLNEWWVAGMANGCLFAMRVSL